jgi:hypothetical protein
MSVKPENIGVNLHPATSNAVYFFSAMLPSLGDAKRLINFGPALFARLEKVQAQRKELEESIGVADADRSPLIKALAEEQMLLQVLEWVRNCDLETNP